MFPPPLDIDRARLVMAARDVAVYTDPSVSASTEAEAVETVSFALRWMAENAPEEREAVGGVKVAILPAPVISPGSGERVNGYTNGVWLVLAAEKMLTMGACGVVAHELAHVAGHQDEAAAWRAAARYLEGSGNPENHAHSELRKLEEGGRS